MRIALSVLAAVACVVPSVAHATMCPSVMIVLDGSGSMADDPSGTGSGMSKMDIAKMALDTLVMEEGDQIPFGFTSFTSDTELCTEGVSVVVSPMDGTKADIIAAIAATEPDGGTNTGPAIDAVSALPSMDITKTMRPASYIVLVTDGEPNCPGTVGTQTEDPAYTVGAIQRANGKGIKTFVVGFGSLPTADKMAMNMMAAAGGEPCMGSSCNGASYYAAEDSNGLKAAISAISTVIVGEFGGACDDSCYSNPCPSLGQICVAGQCVENPCTGVDENCAPGSYCYTDGTSKGVCAPACTSSCPANEICTLTGCAKDPCASMSCSGTCSGGVCHTSGCMNCLIGQSCVAGACKDDPCNYVTCPKDTTCTPYIGSCTSQAVTPGGGGTTKRGGGCDLGGNTPAPIASFGALVALGLALVALRRRRSAV